AVCLAIQVATLVYASGVLRLMWRHSRKLFYLLLGALTLASIVMASGAFATALALLLLFNITLALFLMQFSPVWRELLRLALSYPAMSVAVSFLALISLGTFLLSAPAASETTIAPIDAFFTAVSAAC